MSISLERVAQETEINALSMFHLAKFYRIFLSQSIYIIQLFNSLALKGNSKDSTSIFLLSPCDSIFTKSYNFDCDILRYTIL